MQRKTALPNHWVGSFDGPSSAPVCREDASLTHYQALVENLGQGVFLKDAELRYVVANTAYCDVIGHDQAAVLGQTDFDLQPPARAQKLHAEENRILADGECIESEQQLPIRGKLRTIRIAKKPVRDCHGNVTGVLGISTDVSEQQSLEEQLRRAQKMEAVGQLAGGVAHDLNNLLTAIFGHLAILRAALGENHPNCRLVAEAEQAASRAGTLSAQLLSLSRRTVLNSQQTNLNDAIEEVVGLLHRTLDPRIELMVKREPGLWHVLADQGQIHQVLMNLCLNARDAMPAAGRLQIETTNVTLDSEYARLHLEGRPGDFVRLRVSDTGCGIPPEIRPRIFESFFTTKEAGKGTGLGLAMVFSIVKQHQGWIDCYSEVGAGTRFDVYLPRLVTNEEPTVAPSASSDPPCGGETILLADDEAVLRNLGRAVLERFGYRVLLAEDGQEAVKLYRRERARIHLVILDQTMPRLSGRDALRQIRAINPDVRVLIASGYSMEQVQSPEDGDVGFIGKPYRPQQLAAAVRNALDRPSLETASPRR